MKIIVHKECHHTGDRAKAAQHLTIAATLYREMDMGLLAGERGGATRDGFMMRSRLGSFLPVQKAFLLHRLGGRPGTSRSTAKGAPNFC
jgi:hypothetical protein